MGTPLAYDARRESWEERRRHRRLVGGVFLGAVLALAAVFVVVVVERGGFGGSRSFPWWGFFGIIFLLWILFFAIRVAFWTTRGSGGGFRRGPDGPRHSAWAIARQRYARGEITREQYLQIVNDLQHPPGAP